MASTSTPRIEDLLRQEINKQSTELVVLRLKIEDLATENKNLRRERRMLQEEITRLNADKDPR